nr:Chain D, Dapper 11L6O_E Chain E, Dapper 11L6O_F Chain F, Dapper 1
SLKLMTTV